MLLLGAVSHSWFLGKGICTLFFIGVDTGKSSLLKSCMQSELNSMSHKLTKKDMEVGEDLFQRGSMREERR